MCQDRNSFCKTQRVEGGSIFTPSVKFNSSAAVPAPIWKAAADKLAESAPTERLNFLLRHPGSKPTVR